MARKIVSEEKSYDITNIKRIASQIEDLSIPDKKEVYKIFLSDSKNTFQRNKKDVLFDISKSSYKTLRKVDKYLLSVASKKEEIFSLKEDESFSEMDINIPANTGSPIKSFLNFSGSDKQSEKRKTYKMSNHEKKILRHNDMKRKLDGKEEHPEFTI